MSVNYCKLKVWKLGCAYSSQPKQNSKQTQTKLQVEKNSGFSSLTKSSSGTMARAATSLLAKQLAPHLQKVLHFLGKVSLRQSKWMIQWILLTSHHNVYNLNDFEGMIQGLSSCLLGSGSYHKDDIRESHTTLIQFAWQKHLRQPRTWIIVVCHQGLSKNKLPKLPKKSQVTSK